MQRLSVYGDSAYGSGELLNKLEQADAEVNCKVQPPVAPGGRFAKDAFNINLESGTVSCPAGHTVALRPAGDGQLAQFGAACTGCPLAAKCTTSPDGRTVHVGLYEQQLTRARERQSDPAWKADYTDPSQGRAQDLAPDASPPRRPPRPRPRQTKGRRRLRPACRRR